MADAPNIPDSARAAIRGRRVCVTGGAGFVGARLTRALIGLDASVHVIDDCSTSTGEAMNDLLDASADRLQFIRASILDPAALRDAMDGCALVAHCAALSSVTASVQQPVRCYEVNTLGTARVIEAARAAGAARMVFASSASVYGAASGTQRETARLDPISPYAASKAGAEHAIAAACQAPGFDGVSLRLFNVFGPGQRDDAEEGAVIPAFLARLGAGAPPVVFGDGEQTRDFIHVDDVVRAFLFALTTPAPLNGRAINIGSGRSASINDLAALMSRILGVADVQPRREPARPGDIESSVAEVSLARETLGFEAQTDLETGLRDLPEARDANQSDALAR